MSMKMLRALLGSVLLLAACSNDQPTGPIERLVSGNWSVRGSSYRYSLTEDANGRVTGFGTYSPSNTVLVDGVHNYPNLTLVLKHREGSNTFEQTFSGTYDGRAGIKGRRSGSDEVWERLE